MSNFIEKSKHAQGTAEVEAHFGVGSVGKTGGYLGKSALPADPHMMSEGAPGKGTDYQLKAEAAHYVGKIGSVK